MRKHHSLLIAAWMIAWLGTASAIAGESLSCAELEARHAKTPVLMLSTLYHGKCLGQERDSAQVSADVRKMIPEKPPAEIENDIARQNTDKALARIAAYLGAEKPPTAVTSPSFGSRLIDQTLLRLATLQQRIASGGELQELNEAAWQYRSTSNVVVGLNLAPIRDLCKADINAADCKDAIAGGTVVLRAARLVQHSVHYYNRGKLGVGLQAAQRGEAQWSSYFNSARLQFPWELALNGYLYKREAQKAGGFAPAPNYQWIFLHPTVGLEYVRGAQSGSRFQPALVLEIVGYNRWSYTSEGKMGDALGISVVKTFSDRAGVTSSGHGLMLHYQNKYSFAVTRYGSKTGFMLSTDVGALLTKVDDRARQAFEKLD